MHSVCHQMESADVLARIPETCTSGLCLSSCSLAFPNTTLKNSAGSSCLKSLWQTSTCKAAFGKLVDFDVPRSAGFADTYLLGVRVVRFVALGLRASRRHQPWYPPQNPGRTRLRSFAGKVAAAGDVHTKLAKPTT